MITTTSWSIKIKWLWSQVPWNKLCWAIEEKVWSFLQQCTWSFFYSNDWLVLSTFTFLSFFLSFFLAFISLFVCEWLFVWAYFQFVPLLKAIYYLSFLFLSFLLFYFMASNWFCNFSSPLCFHLFLSPVGSLMQPCLFFLLFQSWVYLLFSLRTSRDLTGNSKKENGSQKEKKNEVFEQPEKKYCRTNDYLLVEYVHFIWNNNFNWKKTVSRTWMVSLVFVPDD